MRTIKFTDNSNLRGTVYTPGEKLETDDDGLADEALKWCKCEEVKTSAQIKAEEAAPRPKQALTTDSFKPARKQRRK